MKKESRYYLNQLYYKNLTSYKGLESFCFQNCLRILLEAKQVYPSVLYLDASLSLIFKADGGDEILGTDDDIRGFISEHTQYSRYYPEMQEDKMDVFKKNIEYITNHNEPIIVGLDTFYMPYATNYQRNHAIHTAILCGYDLDKKVVYLVDWYEPWCFKGEIELDTFLKARDSKNEYDGTIFSGQPIMNNWAKLDCVNQVNKGVLLKQLISKTKHRYFNIENEVRGTEAIKKIIEMIQNKSNIDYEKLHISLYTVGKRFDFFKEWIIQYNDNDNEKINKLVHLLESYVKEWEVLLMLLVKQTRKMSEKTNNRIVTKFNSMIELDEQLDNVLEMFM